MSDNPNQTMDELRFLCYELTLRAQQEIALPEFLGSTLHGGYGWALKQVGCLLPGRHCPPCQFPDQCPYNLLFENKGIAQDRLPKRYAGSPPKLFVIQPPPVHALRLAPGERLSFRLILFGHAIDLRIYPIVAMRVWGENGLGYKRGRFELERIVAVHPLTGAEHRVYSSTDQMVHQNDQPLAVSELLAWSQAWQVEDLVKLTLVTPARLPGRGYTPETLDLKVILKSAVERLSVLSLLCGSSAYETDVATTLAEADRVRVLDRAIAWRDDSRYSKHQGRRMTLGGFTGSLLLRGDFSGLKPFLKLAELLHVGKNTTFGFGQVRFDALV